MFACKNLIKINLLNVKLKIHQNGTGVISISIIILHLAGLGIFFVGMGFLWFDSIY